MRAGRTSTLWPALMATILLATVPVLAGEAGFLVGTVIDEEGKAISGARLTLSGFGAVGPRTAMTDPGGRYRIFVLDAVRPLNILAEAGGKIAVEYKGFRAPPDRVTRFDIRLRSQGAHDVLVLMDNRVPYHHVALDGARSTLPGRVHLLDFLEVTPALKRRILRAVEDRPSAVLAIGEAAAHLARSLVRDVPVVHTMVPDPHPTVMASENLCGLCLTGGFNRHIERLRRLDPDVKRIGTIYDPSRLSRAVAQYRDAAAAAGMTFVAGQVHHSHDLLRVLDDLARADLDAFVVLMDPELYDVRTFELVRQFADEMDLYLLVPDASMAGPAKSFSFDAGFWQSGAVAGRLVRQIVEGTLSPSAVGVRPPTEGEIAAVLASMDPSVEWQPAPGEKPPLIGSWGMGAGSTDAIAANTEPE